MNINDIFLKRKKRWGTINRLRDSEEQADGSLTPSRRIALISDDKSFRELYAQVKTGNPNSFPGYEKKVEANRLKTGQQDAVVTGTCRIGGVKTAVAVMDKRFLMGSMGYAVEREESNENVCCVAIPLRNREGRAVYALSVSAPSFRMGEEAIAHCADLLLGIQPRIEQVLKNA